MNRRLCTLYLIFGILYLVPTFTFAQTIRLVGRVTENGSGDNLYHATVHLRRDSLSSSFGAITNQAGQYVIKNIPIGSYTANVSAAGCQSQSFNVAIHLPHIGDSVEIDFSIEPSVTESREIVVSGTRTEHYIADLPVRVETVTQEDIEEKIMEKPSSVVELLTESMGTRVQSSSGTSNSASIRMQGLDGRYTQILVDGIPSYSGLSSGFGITQLVPLNLQRVEIVKGAASSVYGPDAIAGFVNFITKEPPLEKPQFSAVVNATNQSGYDISAYYGSKIDKMGFTTLVSFDKQQMFDVNGDNFSDIAGFTHVTVTPKVEYQITDDFLATASGTYFQENRRGGVMNATEPAGYTGNAPYIETTATTRIDLNTTLGYTLASDQSITMRWALTQLQQNSSYGAVPFDGVQLFRFADAQYVFNADAESLQVGSAFVGDRFTDRTPLIVARSYEYSDLGFWMQDEYGFTSEWRLLASCRLDDHNVFGTFLTPRASLMFRPSEEFTLRVGGGTGFKAPTIFLEDAEANGFRNTYLRPGIRAERSESGNFDVDYHAALGSVVAIINVAFFTTHLQNALVINPDSNAAILFIDNATGDTWTRGCEVGTSFSVEDLNLAVNYAYLNTRQTNLGNSYQLELNPRDWIGITLSYEDDESGLKAGLESFYIGEQRVENDPFRTSTPTYWLIGALIEKAFGPLHIYVNVENALDVRQSKYESTFLGDPSAGTFEPLHTWAPLEGRTINGGVRIAI